ncbi:MAG: HEAT repeat domain-containing protein [Deltaproteobacteria bacterium]|nr:HEAT repeat domain-containing protein [Deltaproteobacteria bacterium]
MLAKIFEVLTSIAKALVLNHKFGHALTVLRHFDRVRKQVENLPAEKQDSYTRALREMAISAMVQTGDQDIVAVLIRELESEVMSITDRAMKILEMMGTEEVIEQLLGGFRHESRSVRNRCYQTLQALGVKALAVCVWKLRNLNDPAMFPRSGNDMRDEAYYLARNAIDLVAKLGGEKEIELLLEIASDSDYRIRREVLNNLAKRAPEKARAMALAAVADPNKEVVEAAISTLGMLKVEEAVPKLVDIFLRGPEPPPPHHQHLVVDRQRRSGNASPAGDALQLRRKPRPHLPRKRGSSRSRHQGPRRPRSSKRAIGPQAPRQPWFQPDYAGHVLSAESFLPVEGTS